MLETIYKTTENMISKNETFKNLDGGDSDNLYWMILITYLIVLVLVLYLGKYLWNNTLVPAVPMLKPIKTILQFLGVYLVLQLLFTN
jgi:hypothetical protein